MSEIVIRVENLSKKYIIGHKKNKSNTLRDKITENIKKFGRRILHIFTPGRNPLIDFAKKEDFWALKDINLSIKKGERVGFIGSNGAGKSTLLKILSRIVIPTTGKIILKGRVTSLLEVGTGFHSELSGRENVFMSGAILGMKRKEIKQKFDKIIKFSEIEKFIDTPVKRYSSGMYVRLGFSVAAHLDPDILIIDEVLAVGDNKFKNKSMKKMLSIAKNGKTIIFVSHNMDFIRNLCTRVILLKNGQIIFNGDTEEAINLYLNDKKNKK